MNQTEQLDPFDAARIAFDIRFERQLVAIWEERERETHSAIVAAQVMEKHRGFQQFFNDMGAKVTGVIHEYFPSLLQVATTNRRHLANQSPLTWTQAQILTQVCTFLGLDEAFDTASAPRDDSRVLASAERIATGKGWLDDGSPDTFVLPRWAETPHPLDMLWSLQPPEASARHEAQLESEKLSRVETLRWVKYKEFWIHKEIERQIDDEMWDGIIEAGKTGISVLDPIVVKGALPGRGGQAELPEGEEPPNKFFREGLFWSIAFDGETCGLPATLGPDYISVLLQNPGREIGALELQSLVGGLPADTRQSTELVVRSINCDRREQESAEEDRPLSQSDFADDKVVDSTTIRQLNKKLLELEREITRRSEIGDSSAAHELEKEHSAIQSYLDNAVNRHGRLRTFSDENEKARQSITKALKLVYKRIHEQAPKTVDHFKSQIRTGSKFIYRDVTTRWQVRRNRTLPNRPS